MLKNLNLRIITIQLHVDKISKSKIGERVLYNEILSFLHKNTKIDS